MQSLKLVELWPYFKTDFFVSKQYLNPIPYGLFNKPEVMGGGRSAPPSYMAIGGYFEYSFLTGVLSWM